MTPQTNTASTHYIYDQGVSFQAKLFSFFIRIAGLKNMISKDLDKPEMNHRASAMPKKLEKILKVSSHEIDGKTIWTFSPKSGKATQTVIFFHGGAYVYGLQSIYWDFARELVVTSQVNVMLLDYPLAPEQTANDAYNWVGEVYDWALASDHPSNLIFMGDSAGGGLAFGLAQKLRDEQRPLPGQLILLSPWLDLTVSNPELQPSLEKKDVMLSVEALRKAGAAYAGEWDRKDYRVSPLFGQLHKLPPISVFIGTNEIFYPDAEQLKAKFEEQGNPMNYYVYPGLFHDWPVVSTSLKESKLVISQINELLR